MKNIKYILRYNGDKYYYLWRQEKDNPKTTPQNAEFICEDALSNIERYSKGNGYAAAQFTLEEVNELLGNDDKYPLFEYHHEEEPVLLEYISLENECWKHMFSSPSVEIIMTSRIQTIGEIK